MSIRATIAVLVAFIIMLVALASQGHMTGPT